MGTLFVLLSLSGCQTDGSNDSNVESDTNSTNRFWGSGSLFGTGSSNPFGSDFFTNGISGTGSDFFTNGNSGTGSSNPFGSDFFTNAGNSGTGSSNPFGSDFFANGGCKGGCSYRVTSPGANSVCSQGATSGKCSLTEEQLKAEVCQSTPCTVSCSNCA